MYTTLKNDVLRSHAKVWKIALSGLAVMWVASLICVVKTPVPVTLQTVGVHLIGFLMSPSRAFLAIGSWLVAGAAGVPCFGLGSSGLAALMGPTGGYFLGMVLAAPVMSLMLNWARDTWGAKCAHSLYCLFAIGVSGVVLVWALGCLFLGYWLGSWDTAWRVGVQPFLYSDTVKVVLGVLLIKGLKLRRND